MEQAGKKPRQSNLELLRIICIIAIIAEHFLGQNNIPEHTNVFMSGFYVVLNSLSRVGCSVFIIISAWFSVDLPFRSKKFVHIWLTVAMFSLPFLLWQLPRSVFKAEQLQSMFYPVEGTPLWFAGYYLVLMCLSPLLNLLLQKGSRRLAEYVLFFFGAGMTLYSTVTAELGFFSSEIWPLVFMYILTGYRKKYRPIPFWSWNEKLNTDETRRQINGSLFPGQPYAPVGSSAFICRRVSGQRCFPSIWRHIAPECRRFPIW